MRFWILLLVGFLIVFEKNSVAGQTEVDTLGLTGTVADTVVGDRLLEEMKSLIVTRRWEDAEKKGNRALEIYEKFSGQNSRQVGDVLHQKGRIKHLTRKIDEAIYLYQRSLSIRQQILPGQHPDIGASHYNLGLSYYDKGEFYKALDEYHLSIKIRLVSLGKDHLDLAWSYNNIGNTYSKLIDLEKALEYHYKALEIRETNLGQSSSSVAVSHINIGSVLKDMGEYQKAIYHYKIAERICGLSDKYLSELSTIYNNLGNVYSDLDQIEKSIFYIEKSLIIRLKIFGSNHVDVAQSYNNLGLAYKKINIFDSALECLDSALSIRSRLLGPKSQLVAQTYNNFGNLYSDKEEYKKSIFFLERALDILTPILGDSHPTVGVIQNNLASAYAKIGNFEKSIDIFKKTHKIFSTIYGEQSLAIADINNNIGLTFTDRNDHYKAKINYKKALSSLGYNDSTNFKYIKSISTALTALYRLSYSNYKTFIQSGDSLDLKGAVKYAIQSLMALHFQQSTFSEESSKSFWLSKNYPIYEQAISVSLLKANIDKNDTLRHNAFKYAEKSKASLLQAQIKAADAIHFAGIPDSLLQKEHDLRIDITWREKQRQSLLDKGLAETDTNTLRVSSIIFDLKREYEALKQRFETEYPEYYRLKYGLSTVSLQYVQDTLLLPQNQALLEYFVGDSSIYLFVVRPDTMIIQAVKRDFPMESWIDSLRFGLYGYHAADQTLQTDSLKAAAKQKYLEFAPKLYQKLFAPVAQHLPKKVILVPDGPLGYVPFDALLTESPEDVTNFKSYPYLIQKHQFSYTYSATLLREMRDKKHRKEPKNDFIAFAPYYDGDTSLLAGMFKYDDLMRKDLRPLPASGSEVAAAAKLMRGKTVAGTAATEETFTRLAGDYRIIHLATHGHADNRVGDYAFLAFTEIKDSIENELLYVKDLYNLQLNADLVVLSACETGIGKLQRGEGIISLARAFAYAGAKSIVTSLWSVTDKSTSELMRFFYRELKLGKDKDEALRLARLRFLRESSVRNGHPFFWAAFVPIGDMGPVR